MEPYKTKRRSSFLFFRGFFWWYFDNWLFTWVLKYVAFQTQFSISREIETLPKRHIYGSSQSVSNSIFRMYTISLIELRLEGKRSPRVWPIGIELRTWNERKPVKPETMRSIELLHSDKTRTLTTLDNGRRCCVNITAPHLENQVAKADKERTEKRFLFYEIWRMICAKWRMVIRSRKACGSAISSRA